MQVRNTVKFNRRNFRFIRNHLPLDAAKLYMLILYHILYHMLENQHLLLHKPFVNKH